MIAELRTTRWAHRVSISTLLCVMALLGIPGLRADQIVMKNGDRVTGEIVKKDGETLTVKSTHFGTITLPWAEVESIRADEPINIQLLDGESLRGTLNTTGGQVQVVAPGTSQTVPPSNVVALRNAEEQARYERFLNPGVFDLWTVTGSLNFAGAQGNAETLTLTTPLNFARISNNSKTTAYFNSIRSKATIDGVTEETAEAVRGGWAYSRNVSSRIFLNGFNDYEYDRFQALDLRVVLGGGAGYHLWNGERGKLDILGGGAWNREKFDPVPEPSFVRNSSEAYWGDDFAIKMNDRVSITQGFRMFNNLTEGGEYRVNFDIGAVTSLTKWLVWNVSLSNRYLSNPVEGREANDILYSTGLGFTFSRQ